MGIKKGERYFQKGNKLRLGMKLTEEHKKKISKGMKGHQNTLGKKLSEETKRKISKSAKRSFNRGRFKKGQISPQKGSNSWNWKGGITSLNRQIKNSREWKIWRSKVFARDNWTCQTCKKRGTELHPHHIKSFSKILIDNQIKTIEDAVKCKELWNIDNGVTLCKDCHKLCP